MRLFRHRFLLSLSICADLACSQYRHMQRIESDNSCVQKLKPDFSRASYQVSINVIGKHISGLLFIKNMPDSSIRIVFSNQMGLSFFDFGFLPGNGFTVYQIVPQVNKKALIKTLRKDFELILFKKMDLPGTYALKDSGVIYHAYPESKGVNYYITDSTCSHLIKMQRSSGKKPVMEAYFVQDTPNNSPDSIFLRHLNFNFSISLKKIQTLAAQ